MKPDSVRSNYIVRNSLVPILIIQLSSGCTTLQPLPEDRSALEQTVKPGDKVHVITRDGNEKEFKVTQVTEQRIEGENQSVAMDDIAKIERRDISGWKTGGLAFGVTIVVLGALFIYALSQAAFFVGG
jgi:hypothetical protein